MIGIRDIANNSIPACNNQQKPNHFNDNTKLTVWFENQSCGLVLFIYLFIIAVSVSEGNYKI